LLSVLMETMTASLNVLLMVFALMTTDAQAQESSALRMVQTIPLPNVEGRIDHMAIDLNGQRLFIAALKTIPLKYWI
jgi:hypothetical protein